MYLFDLDIFIKRLLFFLIIYLIFGTVISYAQRYSQIVNYHVESKFVRYNNENFLSLRSFDNEGLKYKFILNPITLETKVVNAQLCQIPTSRQDIILAQLQETTYYRAIAAIRKTENNLQDAGLNQHFRNENGINLTIDLCPSHKPLDRIVFQDLFKAFGKNSNAVPLSISLSGKWILNHTDDLNWLLKLVKNNFLKITWINHSYNHSYNHYVNKLALDQNFLLAKGTNLNSEILNNEKLMLSMGIIPSVFFRFPGLVSDKVLLEEVLSYDLLPVGSDAWLAKRQQLKNGSIVLIHANGNEEIGVQDFIKLLNLESSSIRNKQWSLHDLNESLENN